MSKTELHGLLNLAGIIQGLGEGVLYLLSVVRMGVLEGVLSDPLFRKVVQYPLDSRALIADGAVLLKDRDEIGGVLDEGPKALLALF